MRVGGGALCVPGSRLEVTAGVGVDGQGQVDPADSQAFAARLSVGQSVLPRRFSKLGATGERVRMRTVETSGDLAP